MMMSEQQHVVQRQRPSRCKNIKETLYGFAKTFDVDFGSIEFAHRMDEEDPLRSFRDEFHVPKSRMLPETDVSLLNDGEDEDCVYFCGNSLGLCPRRTETLVQEELKKWQNRGVIGHFDDSPRPWVSIQETVKDAMARVVGARPNEVAVMNSLTVNLHLMMCSFYVPTPTRSKILIETNAFPSDHHAVVSQLNMHGYDPETNLILAAPRDGELTLRTEDLLDFIAADGDSIALIMLSGIQYYTGQLFDIPAITAAGQAKGCIVGWDLAHAAGNVDLRLHDDGVDFACWCSYKYLNSGPGGIAGIFVHEKHDQDCRPRLAGWWGNREDSRFRMENVFDPIIGAGIYQLSNPPVLQTVSLLASLEIFDLTDMTSINDKTYLITGYLETLLLDIDIVKVLTPTDPMQRGSQLSLVFDLHIEHVFKELELRGVVCDKREPHVIRVAPAPLYSRYIDVWRFVKYLKQSIAAVSKF